MEIFGVGGMELVAVLLIALIVAGPKRLLAWSYTLGKWAASARRMWSETAALLQKEFDDAGVDIKVPTEPPTRQSLNNEMKKLTNPVTKPLQDTLESVKTDMDKVREATDIRRTTITPPKTPPPAKPAANGAPPPAPPVPPPSAERADEDAPAEDNRYGTWSG